MITSRIFLVKLMCCFPDFWDATGHNVKKLFSPEFAAEVSHEIDGLIFQPIPDVRQILLAYFYLVVVDEI